MVILVLFSNASIHSSFSLRRSTRAINVSNVAKEQILSLFRYYYAESYENICKLLETRLQLVSDQRPIDKHLVPKNHA